MNKSRNVDVLVVGGGPAGFAAALAASRAGAETLLIERSGRLGGMATNALVSPFLGMVDSTFVSDIIERIGGREVDPSTLDLNYADMLVQENTQILLHTCATAAIMSGDTITGCTAFTKQGRMDFSAAVTIDASGDGDIAYSAGAAFEQGRPGDGLTQPVSVMFRIGGVGPSPLLCGSEGEAAALTLPDGTWEQIVERGMRGGELPKNVGVIRTYATRRPSEITVNATQVNYIDGTSPADLTKAELESRRQAHLVTEFLRKHAPGYKDCFISEMPAVIGVRETRRFVGCDYLTRSDLLEGRKRSDAVVENALFVIDIHNPDGPGQSEGSAVECRPYDIPYGCLVPRKIDGLLLAGRCISGSHDAHASYRVMTICLAIGAAAGAAAAIAAHRRISPRQVSSEEIRAAVK